MNKKLKEVGSEARIYLEEESSRKRGLEVQRPCGRNGEEGWRNSEQYGWGRVSRGG